MGWQPRQSVLQTGLRVKPVLMDTMTTEPKRKRQARSPEVKAGILAECDRPGASIAKVALAHGVNANLVHGCRTAAASRPRSTTA